MAGAPYKLCLIPNVPDRKRRAKDFFDASTDAFLAVTRKSLRQKCPVNCLEKVQRAAARFFQICAEEGILSVLERPGSSCFTAGEVSRFDL
jgi:hypothetical protein